jgi:hypothetical protein
MTVHGCVHGGAHRPLGVRHPPLDALVLRHPLGVVLGRHGCAVYGVHFILAIVPPRPTIDHPRAQKKVLMDDILATERQDDGNI